METFEILSLDVWGNKEEGFEINAAYHTRKYIEMTKDQYENDEWIIEQLIELGYLTEEAREKVSIEGDSGFLEVFAEQTGEPLYQLQII